MGVAFVLFSILDLVGDMMRFGKRHTYSQFKHANRRQLTKLYVLVWVEASVSVSCTALQHTNPSGFSPLLRINNRPGQFKELIPDYLSEFGLSHCVKPSKLAPGTLRIAGQVRGRRGRQIPNARVVAATFPLNLSQPFDEHAVSGVWEETTTDINGCYELNLNIGGRPNTMLWSDVQAMGFLSPSGPLDVIGWSRNFPLKVNIGGILPYDFELRRGLYWHGRVLDKKGQPIARANVVVADCTVLGGCGIFSRTITNDTGEFQLFDLPARSRVIFAHPEHKAKTYPNPPLSSSNRYINADVVLED